MTSAIRHWRRLPRSPRVGFALATAKLLGIAAVLFNVFAWALLDTPASSAAFVSAIAAADDGGVAFCGHSPANRGGQPGHPVCPQCFPLGNPCSGALAPAAIEVAFVVTEGAAEDGYPPRPMLPAEPPFHHHARAPPVLT